jgi:glycosyltransferase involved in cell wall biosynthesis
MQKVVHIIHRDDIGGGGSVVMQHLRYYGLKYETWLLHGSSGLLSKACDELNIRHIRLPIDTMFKSLFGVFVVAWWLRKIKPDLLILHGQWGGPLGAVAGKLAGVKRMIYIAHWPSFYTDWDLYRTVRNFIAEWIPIRLCSRAVTLSHANRYQYLIRSTGIEDKITSLSNMVSLSKIPTAEDALEIRRRFNWKPDEVHVVSVGRVVTQKRVDWLLQSWKLLQDRGCRAHLWIVGGGEQWDEVKRLALELKLGDSCTFLGPQPDGIKFIAASDIVAMTTVYESNALIPMEAMACSKPVVASAADGVRDTFADEREGFQVPPGNVKIFADRLETLIRDESLRRQMGQAGRIHVKIFDAEEVLKRYVMLIELELSKS